MRLRTYFPIKSAYGYSRRFDVLWIGFARLEFRLEKLGVCEDHRQQVVEIVGDPAGQATDRFEALRSTELHLQAFTFADVPPHDVQKRLFTTPHDGKLDLDEEVLSIGAEVRPLESVASALERDSQEFLRLFKGVAAIRLKGG